MNNKPAGKMTAQPEPTLFSLKREVEEIKLSVAALHQDIKEVQKQYKSIQTSLDAIYNDRDLLTDIINSVRQGQKLTIDTDKHNEKLVDKLEEKMEQNSNQVRAEVHVTSHEIKNTIIQKVVKGVKTTLRKKNATVIKSPWYKRLLFWRERSKVKVEI